MRRILAVGGRSLPECLDYTAMARKYNRTQPIEFLDGRSGESGESAYWRFRRCHPIQLARNRHPIESIGPKPDRRLTVGPGLLGGAAQRGMRRFVSQSANSFSSELSMPIPVMYFDNT